jgi:hypothetical protein
LSARDSKWGKSPIPFLNERRKQMATTKMWKVQKRLDHVIDYATNEEKTRKNSNGYEIDRFDSIR